LLLLILLLMLLLLLQLMLLLSSISSRPWRLQLWRRVKSAPHK
jgi:hypothetical protein